MESFLKKIVLGNFDNDNRMYFLRFGKGDYKRRFLISFTKGAKVKIRGSFEWANDFVNFVRENKDLKFSGMVLSKDKVAGLEGKKKGGTFIYEVSESSLKEFENPYYYLLNCNDEEIVLKIKKSLPKPGKDEGKIDDKFCSLDLDLKYWDALKDAFFWDFPDCKKASIEHEIVIDSVDIPSGVSADKVRELAKRKGKLIRRINCDGKEIVNEYDLEV